MNTYTGVSARPPSFSPRTGAAPRPYGGAAQQHFEDVYRQSAQQASVDLDRQNTKQAADFHSNAQQAQNQSVLAGLGLLNTQQQNAWQRQNAQSQMAYGLMNDIMGGFGGMLKGLL